MSTPFALRPLVAADHEAVARLLHRSLVQMSQSQALAKTHH
jgi:hypothetical protein